MVWQAGSFDGTFGKNVRASNIRAEVENLIAEAMAATEQQHRFFFELFAHEALVAADGVIGGDCSDKILIVEGLHHEAGLRNGQSHDGAVNLAVFELIE